MNINYSSIIEASKNMNTLMISEYIEDMRIKAKHLRNYLQIQEHNLKGAKNSKITEIVEKQLSEGVGDLKRFVELVKYKDIKEEIPTVENTVNDIDKYFEKNDKDN